MEKLNAEQLSRIELAPSTGMGTPSTPFFEAMKDLLVGEGVVIKDVEWPLKNRPNVSTIPPRLRTPERKFSARALADQSGFVIIRIQ